MEIQKIIPGFRVRNKCDGNCLKGASVVGADSSNEQQLNVQLFNRFTTNSTPFLLRNLRVYRVIAIPYKPHQNALLLNTQNLVCNY